MVALWRNGRRYRVMDWAEKANAEYSPVQIQVLPEQFLLEISIMNYIICKRSIIEVNIDPLGRCYDGCHAKSEFVWTDWEKLEYWSSQEIRTVIK